jgi:hypothetical protein
LRLVGKSLRSKVESGKWKSVISDQISAIRRQEEEQSVFSCKFRVSAKRKEDATLTRTGRGEAAWRLVEKNGGEKLKSTVMSDSATGKRVPRPHAKRSCPGHPAKTIPDN